MKCCVCGVTWGIEHEDAGRPVCGTCWHHYRGVDADPGPRGPDPRADDDFSDGYGFGGGSKDEWREWLGGDPRHDIG